MKQFKRSKRVGDQMRKEMSIVVYNATADQSLPMITVTDVSLSDDLKYAKVYFSAFGEDNARETALEFLSKKAKALRSELSRRIRIKYMPEITFHFDESIETGLRIESILSELDDVKKSPDKPTPSPPNSDQ